MRICRRTGVYYGGNGLPKFSYTGTYEILDEGDRNWNVKFLTSGTLILTRDLLIDAFLVGGGASAAVGGGSMAPGCGGGGYTSTYFGITLDRNTSYSVVIGAGGAAVTVSASEGNDGGKTWIAAEATYYAEGGHKGLHALSTGKVGGNGGSGGGGYQGTGGTDGGDGLPASGWMVVTDRGRPPGNLRRRPERCIPKAEHRAAETRRQIRGMEAAIPLTAA